MSLSNGHVPVYFCGILFNARWCPVHRAWAQDAMTHTTQTSTASGSTSQMWNLETISWRLAGNRRFGRFSCCCWLTSLARLFLHRSALILTTRWKSPTTPTTLCAVMSVTLATTLICQAVICRRKCQVFFVHLEHQMFVFLWDFPLTHFVFQLLNREHSQHRRSVNDNAEDCIREEDHEVVFEIAFHTLPLNSEILPV